MAGKIETALEIRLLIKANRSDYEEIESLIKATHSYENPEIIAIPVVAGSQRYLDWISDEGAKTLSDTLFAYVHHNRRFNAAQHCHRFISPSALV